MKPNWPTAFVLGAVLAVLLGCVAFDHSQAGTVAGAIGSIALALLPKLLASEAGTSKP